MDPQKVHTMDDKSPVVERYPAHISVMTAISEALLPVTSFGPDIGGYVVSIRDIVVAAESSSVRSDRSVPSDIRIPCDDDNNSVGTTKMSDDCTVSVTSEAATANSQQLSFLTRQTTNNGAPCFPVPQQLLQASSSSAPPAAGDLFANFVTFVTAATPPQQQQQRNEEARLQCMMQLFEQMVIAAVQAQCNKAGTERNCHHSANDEHRSRQEIHPQRRREPDGGGGEEEDRQ